VLAEEMNIRMQDVRFSRQWNFKSRVFQRTLLPPSQGWQGHSECR